MMIVISGTISSGRIPFSGLMDRPRHLRLQCPRLELQRLDRRAVDFGGEFEFAARVAACRRPEQDRGDAEIDGAEDGRGRYGAPDLDQREIRRQLQHQEAERGDQRRERPQAEADQHVPHPDLGDDPVGAPERAQMFDDVFACSR